MKGSILYKRIKKKKTEKKKDGRRNEDRIVFGNNL
jgi:hypothetical protein